VPKDIRFKTKPQIALDQIRAAHAEGVAPGIVLADDQTYLQRFQEAAQQETFPMADQHRAPARLF
jgi:hypothetical protein